MPARRSRVSAFLESPRTNQTAGFPPQRNSGPSQYGGAATGHPPLDDIEMHVTFTELGIAMTIATLILMKVKEKTKLWDEFQALLRR